MKNEIRDDFESTIRLTPQYLQKLKESGFRYVQIKTFTWDRRQDYMDPHYFILTPIKDFPKDPAKKEIFEPINSKILEDWSNSTDDHIKVMISKIKV